MQNNLQANSLNLASSSIFLASKKFKIPKKLEPNSCLMLDTKELKATLYQDAKAKSKAKIIFEDGYFFAYIEPLKKATKQKEPKKDEAYIKIELHTLAKGQKIALCKMPIEVVVVGKKSYLAKLYYKDAFYIKIKDIL
jgi:hypothetical protein